MIKKVLIIAGGTGGHIFPALVIAEALTKQEVSIAWLGAEVGMEKKLVGDRYPLHLLPIRAIRGKRLLGKLSAPWQLLKSIFLGLKVVRKINPDVVIGMGGYASGPGGLAAWLLRKPLIIHEQNAIPGLTNRILSHFAQVVLQAFPNTFPQKTKAKTVGNPVRPAFYALPDVASRFSSRSQPLRVLVLGGSQGAHAINKTIVNTLSHLGENASVIFWHQTGARDLEFVQQAYQSYVNNNCRLEAFIDDVPAAYGWADLVICRSGALTVSEIMAAGIASILVPYPSAVDDHQTANAKQLADAGVGLLVSEADLTPDWLAQKLANFCQDSQQLAIMAERARSLAKEDAVAAIVSLIRRTSSNEKGVAAGA